MAQLKRAREAACPTCRAASARPTTRAGKEWRKRLQRKAARFDFAACLRCDGADAPAEREADRAARAALGGQRVEPTTERARGGEPDGALRSTLESAAGGGMPLPDTVRQTLEPRLGTDLSDVRVHADGLAHRLATQLGAEAFTYGPDIYFRQGAYDPASQKGRETIAHEVVHTVQQRDTAPAIQRRRERTEPLDLTGLTVVAQAIHDALYPTGDSWIAGMAEAVLPHVYVGMIAPVARVVGLRSPDERRAIDTLRRTPDKAGLRSVYHAIYGRSVERDFLARTSERTFREVLLIVRPSYSLVDLVRVYLLRYPFPDSGLLLPIAAGRYFGDDAILAAMRIATRADLDELASHAALLNELSDEMEVGSWYEATKLLDPARTSTMFREAAAARMRMAGDDLGTVLDVLLDIPQEHRPAFWNRYGANASGLDGEDIPIAARVAVGTDATGYATRLEVAARAGDQAAIERAIQGLAQIRHARRVLESTPDAPDRESALERLGDVDELLEVTEFGGLPAPIRALARSGAAAQTIDAARRLGVPLFPVAVTTILEHASDYGQILAVLRAIPDSNTRRGVWEEVRAIVEARIVSEEISQEEFDRLAGVATGDSYETALAELTAAIQSNDVNALFTVIEGMSAADRDRLRSSPPPFWRGLVANRHVGGRFLAQTAETGVIPSQALIAYALSGVTPNRELLEVALEALPDTERARYRRGYYLLSEGIEPQSDSDRQAVADYQRLFAVIDNYFGRESRTALLEQLLDVPSPEALTTPQGRLEAAAILRRRLLVRAAMEGDAAGEIFTDADENLFAATMEFERLYQEAIRGGEIDEEEMQALLHLDAAFRAQYATYSQDLAEIGSVGATIAAIAVSLVVMAVTGGAGAPTVAVLLARMGASGLWTAVSRVGAHRLLRGEHFELDSAEARQEAAAGFVEGALAPLTNRLAAGVTGLVGLRGAALAQGAGRLTVQAAEAGAQRAGYQLVGASVEGAIDGFLGAVLGETALRAADARAWRRGLVQWLAANGEAILRAGAIGAFTGAVTSTAIHGVTAALGGQRGGRRTADPSLSDFSELTPAQVASVARASRSFRIGGRTHEFHVVGDTLVLCSKCGAFHERLRLLAYFLPEGSDLQRQLHALADEALDYHRRVIRAGEAGPALDSTAVRDFERRLAELGSDHPELSEMLGESLVELNRRADEMARQRGGEEEVRADRERRVEIAYQAALDRGYRGSQDDFIQNYLEGRVLEGGSWQRVDVTSQAARLPADADSATALQILRRGEGFAEFERLLARAGVEIADEAALLRALDDMAPLGGRKVDYVRHELKSAFRPQLLENLTGFYQGHPRRAELMEALRREYPRAGWANDQDAAFRAALHRRFLELTRDLAPSDRGNLFEAFNRRVHLAADPTAVAVVPHPLLRQEVLAELGVELRSSRVPDALVVLDVTGETARVRIHDDKYYTGVLSEHAMQQIDDYARILNRERNPGLIPYELTLPNGRRITAIDVTEVVISFPDAQALEPNLSFVEQMVRRGVAFQVFDPLGHPHIIRSIGDLQSFQQLIGHQTTVIP